MPQQKDANELLEHSSSRTEARGVSLTPVKHKKKRRKQDRGQSPIGKVQKQEHVGLAVQQLETYIGELPKCWLD